jgi:hypothetical protein
MAIPSRQIGWSTKSNLLWQIAKQMEQLNRVLYKGSTTTTTTTTIATDYYYLNNEGFTIPPSAACASTTGMFNVQFIGEGVGFCDTPIDDVLFTSDTVLPAGDYWAFNNISNTVRRFESTGTQPYRLFGVCQSPC